MTSNGQVDQRGHARRDGSGGAPLRVLQLVESLARAGAEQSLVALAPQLRDHGIDLHVAYLIERNGLRPELERFGIPVHSLDVGRHSRTAYVRETRRLIREIEPAVVHTSVFEADLAGRIAAAAQGIPCVSSLINVTYGPAERRGLPVAKVRAAHVADLGTAQLVSRFHAVTPYVAEVMGRRLLVPKSRIEFIPRGRDPEHLGRRTPVRRAQTRARIGVDETTPLVLAVGRLTRQKGIDVLVDSMPHVIAAYPDVRLLVAGRDGGESGGLAARVDRLGLADQVTFLGERDDVADLLAAADVFAFPSRWEGAAGTLLEAMALECPIVSSALPTLGETVDANSALLVPPEDAAAFGAAVVETLRHPDAAGRRARTAKVRFEEGFTISRVAQRTADLYRAVASQPSRLRGVGRRRTGAASTARTGILGGNS